MGDSHDGPGYSIDELCQLIVARHHAYLHRALPLIGSELDRLTETEGVPAGLLAGTREVFADLREHHRIESEVLFPRALELERRLP